MNSRFRIGMILTTVIAMAGIAWAAPAITIDATRRWLKAGFYSGTGAPNSTSNLVTKMTGSPATYVDFAQLTDGGCETVALNFDTTTAAAPNPGDPCIVGVGAVLGVTSVNLLQQDIHSIYSCFVGVDGGGFLRRCQSVAQGAYNPDGGTFYLRAISSQ